MLTKKPAIEITQLRNFEIGVAIVTFEVAMKTAFTPDAKRRPTFGSGCGEIAAWVVPYVREAC